MAENRKLIRNSPAYEGPSESANIVADVPAGTVVPALPADLWSDDAFFKARLGPRNVYFLAADAEESDEQVSQYEVPDPPEPPAEAPVVWKRYAEEVGGTYSTPPARRLGPFTLYSHEPTVEVVVENWVIVLETFKAGSGESSPILTRMRASYAERHPLTFHVYRRNILSDLGKRFFNQQDITIGEADFDRDFIIEGSDESAMRKLLANAGLRTVLCSRTDLYLKSKGEALVFTTKGITADIDLLGALHSLFVETLRELQRMGFIR